MIVTRESCEKEFGLALSRYVGYTTGAYHIIDRIADITAAFDGKTFLYEVELTKILKEKYQVGYDYAVGITNFASGLGFIEKFDRGSQMARFSITPIGRAYRAALALNNEIFKKFIFSYAVFQYDCDVYGLVLDLASEDKLKTGSELHSEFLYRTIELRQARSEWIERTFPNRILRERVEKHIQWIKTSNGQKSMIIKPGKDFARHHVTPRKGWAQDLGHLKENGTLTDEGRRLLSRLKGKQESYFWLAPSKECFHALNIPLEETDWKFAPAWNLFRPKQIAEEPFDEIVERVAQFMEAAYTHISLTKTNQASLDSVMPYSYFIEYQLGKRVNEDSLFKQIFSKYRGIFAPMSKRNSLLGHYQLRIKL